MSTDEDSVDIEDKNEQEGVKPAGQALTINIQSWATPIVGAIMLVVGLLAGYFIRPLLPSITAAEPTPIAAATAETLVSTETAAQTTEQPANLQELMAYLMPQVKHFRGDEKAPVTILEFSDFQ